MVATAVAYGGIAAAIALSPWFSFSRNALSDLGHALRSPVASLFNTALSLGGVLMILFALCYLRSLYRYTPYALAAASYALVLVAVFDEVYGRLHYAVSVAFFVLMAVSTALYTAESRRLALGTTLLIVGVGSWVLYFQGVYRSGVAVPELVSSLSSIAWVLLESVRGGR